MAMLAQADKDVKIPAAVRAAAAKADEVFNANYKKDDSQAPAEPTTAQANDNKPAEPVTDVVDAPAPQVAADDAPIVTPEVTPPPAVRKDNEWEHKYNSMKGRYDRAERVIQQQADRITNLEGTIAAMQVRATDAPPELSPQRLVTPEEKDQWGDELLSVVGKRAKEEVLPEVEALKSQIASLQKKLDGVGGYVTQNARTRMIQDLDADLPNWKALNSDPNFLNWLALPDTYSGVIRQELLNAAYERNDSPRVLAFFKGFLAEEAATAPQAEHQPTPPAKPAPKVPLEAFAAPGRAKTAAAPAPAEKPIITRAQIAKFYVDVNAGKYRGRDAEKDGFERQIFEAQRDGRIR